MDEKTMCGCIRIAPHYKTGAPNFQFEWNVDDIVKGGVLIRIAQTQATDAFGMAPNGGKWPNPPVSRNQRPQNMQQQQQWYHQNKRLDNRWPTTDQANPATWDNQGQDGGYGGGKGGHTDQSGGGTYDNTGGKGGYGDQGTGGKAADGKNSGGKGQAGAAGWHSQAQQSYVGWDGWTPPSQQQPQQGQWAPNPNSQPYAKR